MQRESATRIVASITIIPASPCAIPRYRRDEVNHEIMPRHDGRWNSVVEVFLGSDPTLVSTELRGDIALLGTANIFGFDPNRIDTIHYRPEPAETATRAKR